MTKTTAQQMSTLDSADAMEQGGIVAVDVLQDWKHETTTYVFADGSKLVVSGVEVFVGVTLGHWTGPMASAVKLMDDDLREALHAQGFASDQEFLDAYANAHAEKFGEQFVVG